MVRAMTTGPGKYDDICTIAREMAQAEAAIIVILNGNKGTGFSVQALGPAAGASVLAALAGILRNIADTIERDTNASDDLEDMIFSVETLKEKEVKALIAKLAGEAEFTFFKIGGALYMVQKNKWWKPYASLRDFIEEEYGFGYHKAMYWISIYVHLTESQVEWSKVKDLGWSKLKEIAHVVTPENVDKWVATAKANGVRALADIVRRSEQR